MPRPAPRTPATPPPAAAPAEPLAPAPDNGLPFSTERPKKKTSRRGKPATKPMTFRLPEDLSDRLQETSEATDIPMTAIVVRGLRAELDRINGTDER